MFSIYIVYIHVVFHIGSFYCVILAYLKESIITWCMTTYFFLKESRKIIFLCNFSFTFFAMQDCFMFDFVYFEIFDNKSYFFQFLVFI